MAEPARIIEQFFNFMISPSYNRVINAMFPPPIYSTCRAKGLKNRWGLVPVQMKAGQLFGADDALSRTIQSASAKAIHEVKDKANDEPGTKTNPGDLGLLIH